MEGLEVAVRACWGSGCQALQCRCSELPGLSSWSQGLHFWIRPGLFHVRNYLNSYWPATNCSRKINRAWRSSVYNVPVTTCITKLSMIYKVCRHGTTESLTHNNWLLIAAWFQWSPHLPGCAGQQEGPALLFSTWWSLDNFAALPVNECQLSYRRTGLPAEVQCLFYLNVLWETI